MIHTSHLMGSVGLIGVAASTAMEGLETFPSIERLGISAVTIVILCYILKLERAERQKIGEDYRALQEEVRKGQNQVIEGHAEAMKENAKALNRLADVLDGRKPSP